MTTRTLLGPIVMGVVAIVFAPLLPWVTNRLDRLIAVPELDRPQRSMVGAAGP